MEFDPVRPVHNLFANNLAASPWRINRLLSGRQESFPRPYATFACRNETWSRDLQARTLEKALVNGVFHINVGEHATVAHDVAQRCEPGFQVRLDVVKRSQRPVFPRRRDNTYGAREHMRVGID